MSSDADSRMVFAGDGVPPGTKRFEVVYREDIEAASKEEAVEKALEEISRALNKTGSIEFRVKEWINDPKAIGNESTLTGVLHFVKVGKVDG